MKEFEIVSGKSYKPSTKGKGFPRHLYKTVALDEDEAVCTVRSMSKSHEGDQYSYRNSWLNDNHIRGWLRKRVGKDADKVFSEFKEAFGSKGKYSPLEYFRDFVDYDNGQSTRPHLYTHWKPQYTVDSQNRIQKNPEYKTYRQLTAPEYDAIYVEENKLALEAMKERIQKSNSYKLFGPVKIPKQLWIVHPKTGQPVKAPVHIVRYGIFSEVRSPYNNPLVPYDKPKQSQIQWIQDNFIPVSVIDNAKVASTHLKVDNMDGTGIYYRTYYQYRYVVPKSFID